MKKGERRNSGEKQEEEEEAGGEKKERKTSQAFHRQVRLDHAGFFGALAAGAAEVLDPIILMASWWQKFDEDANDHVDFSEFVLRYPSTVRDSIGEL